MTETPITENLDNKLLRADYGYEIEIDEWKNSHEKLELAANKLYSRLSIWVNTASMANYLDPKDAEALAEFELLKKHD